MQALASNDTLAVALLIIAGASIIGVTITALVVTLRPRRR